MLRRTICTVGLSLSVTLGLAGHATAAIIEWNPSGTSVSAGSGFTLGQSVTTMASPGVAPWDHISFNLVDSQFNPYAVGTLFLLTQAYAGTEAGLSSVTPGFLASTSNTTGGVWTFAPTVMLQGSTKYFFYLDTPFDGSRQILFNDQDPLGGGEAYQGFLGVPFHAVPNVDLRFSLEGTPVARVPEPASLLLLVSSLGAVAARRRFRQRTQRCTRVTTDLHAAEDSHARRIVRWARARR
jgi:hypothetical protein